MRRNLIRWTGAAAAIAALVTGGLSAMPAAAGTAAAPPGGWVRFGHFAPAAAPVDLYVDGAPAATGIGYKTVSAYIPVASGPHEFTVRPQGEPDAAPVLQLEAGVPDGEAITIGAVVTRDGLAGQVYDDDLTPPADGQSLVRFIHAVPDQQPVDIAVAGGPTIASAVSYPNATAYLPIAAGTYDVDVRAAGTPDVLLHIAGWSIAPGAQASVIVISGADGRLDVVPLVDSAAAAVVPAGGVQTGYGGMAPPAPNGNGWATAAAAGTGLAAAAVGLLIARRRRQLVRT